LPTEFSAPLLAVIHLGEGGSFLREVLQRCTRLQVVSPQGPEPITSGRIYIASPNRHLTVRDGCVMTSPGPRENRHRPAIDVLFRSAARSYRADVVAVILSGALDDGVAGSLAVKARGGTVIIQDPEEAATPDMPSNVLKRVRVDHSLRLAEIGPFLSRLAANGESTTVHDSTSKECDHSQWRKHWQTSSPWPTRVLNVAGHS
jgi:two-component system chemotaxis response regulator CheB